MDHCINEARIKRNERDIQALFTIHNEKEKTAMAHLVATIMTLIGVISTFVVALAK